MHLPLLQKEVLLQSKSGTSNLMKHLTVCKQYFAHSDGQSSTQQVIDDEGNLADAKVSEETFRKATNEMMMIGELPLAWIEGVTWKHFCNKMKLGKQHQPGTL